MSLQKLPDWESRLNGWIDRAQNTPFVWGRFDCCLAMADAVLAMTGIDIAQGWRGRCTDMESAVRLVCRETGETSFIAAIDAILVRAGLRCLTSPAFACRGDVVMAEAKHGPTWGVVDLTGRRAVYAAQAGIEWAKLGLARRAWAV